MSFTSHETFFAIAYRNHELVTNLVRQREARPTKDDHDVDFHCAKNAEIQRAAMVSVIFSALTLEAFNNYGIEHFSRSYFDNHLDKLPAVSKWIVIPTLAVGKEIDSDSQSYEQLKRLFKRRDRLVHYMLTNDRLHDIIGVYHANQIAQERENNTSDQTRD